MPLGKQGNAHASKDETGEPAWKSSDIYKKPSEWTYPWPKGSIFRNLSEIIEQSHHDKVKNVHGSII